jgi:flagellar biosynthesis protein FlhF
MQVVQFITDNAASALEQIHRRLGPEAVVLSVRRLPGQGMARLWPKSGRIEVLAGVPDNVTPPAVPEALAGQDRRLKSLPSGPAQGVAAGLPASPDLWPSVAWLGAMGLLPENARRLQDHLNALHPAAPASLDAEWEVVITALVGIWSPLRPLRHSGAPQTHVFIGPPGSGKTTVLCKWLTLAVLTEERSACVWRLDSNIANTAEFLTVHCEMLGTPVERVWSAPKIHADLHLVDLPGTEADDPQALAALRSQLLLLPSPQVHLVLNAAYETGVLLTQLRTFAELAPADLIITHLDEEIRRIKLWNIVFGTNCAMRFLSGGQKIPGEFQNASPDLLFRS